MKGAAILAVVLIVVGLGLVYVGWSGQSKAAQKAVTG
jgi:hypothetical protein